MPARQGRSELAAIIASGVTRAVATRAGPPEVPGDSGTDGLALSDGARPSVRLAVPFDRNGRKDGEHA